MNLLVRSIALLLASLVFSACATTPMEQPKAASNQPEVAPKNRVQIEKELAGDPIRSVMHFDTYKEALDFGASVYVCKVERREPTVNGNYNESGRVTLTVVKVLRGPARPTIALPHSFASYLGYDRARFLWPKFAVGDSLICVLVPTTHDPTTPRYPDINEAARWVANMNEDQARKIEAACEEFNKPPVK